MKTIKINELKNGQYVQFKQSKYSKKWCDGLYVEYSCFSSGKHLYIHSMEKDLEFSFGTSPYGSQRFVHFENVRVPVIKKNKVTYLKVIE